MPKEFIVVNIVDKYWLYIEFSFFFLLLFDLFIWIRNKGTVQINQTCVASNVGWMMGEGERDVVCVCVYMYYVYFMLW